MAMKDWMKRMPLAGTRCMLYRQRDLQDLVVRLCWIDPQERYTTMRMNPSNHNYRLQQPRNMLAYRAYIWFTVIPYIHVTMYSNTPP